MTVRRRMRDLIVVQTPRYPDEPVANEYGDADEAQPDYWDATQVRALVTPLSSSEAEEDRETMLRRFELFMAPDTAINGNSRVLYQVSEDVELTCRVIGEPTLYRGFTHGSGHLYALIENVEG